MIQAYVGIDPGINGAIALLSGNFNQIYDVPTFCSKAGKVYDFRQMHRLLNGISTIYIVSLSLEQQQAMHGQGVVSTFKTGRGYGAWEALCCVTFPNDFEIVSPRKWKKALGLDSDKEKSRKMAIELYPEFEPLLRRKKDHDRAEAVLLAYYTQLKKNPIV